jgi:large subunit ribosomal protein L15
MKLHELRPAAGSRTARTRVGRGIAAGKGKTAGRGTKGQKARAGSSIPAWFEGGQTPLHQRIPKLRGFRNPFKLEYEVVNLGRISALVELGALEAGDLPGSKPKAGGKPAPVTVNQEILKAVGLVRSLDKPLKVLGQGDVTRPLFVVADAFSKSATSKIEAAGGTASVIEMPTARGSRRRPEASAGEATAPTPPVAAEERPAAAKTAPAGEEAAAEAPGAAEAPKSRAKARGKASAPRTAAAAEEPSGAQPAEDAVSVESDQTAIDSASTPASTTGRKPRGRATSRPKGGPNAKAEPEPEASAEVDDVAPADGAQSRTDSASGDESPPDAQPAGDA